MSRPDAARERWKDTKRSAPGQAEGHHNRIALSGRLCCFYGTLRGEAEKPEKEMSPPSDAPAAEEQKANFQSPSRAVASLLSWRRDTAPSSRQGSLRPTLPFKSRLEAASLRAPWALPWPWLDLRALFPRGLRACPPPPPLRAAAPTADSSRAWTPGGPGGQQAPRPLRLPVAPRGGGPTEASFFVVEMGVVGSRYTLKDHVGSLSIPPRAVGGRRERACINQATGFLVSTGHFLSAYCVPGFL